MGNILLENPEAETRWYFKYFLGHDHMTYLAIIVATDEEREQVGRLPCGDTKATPFQS